MLRTDLQGSTVKLYDIVTMNTVHEHDYQRFCNYFKTGNTCTVDLSEVTEADSVCVALLVAAKRLAHQHQFDLHITGVPAGLITLMTLYGVEGSLK